MPSIDKCANTRGSLQVISKTLFQNVSTNIFAMKLGETGKMHTKGKSLYRLGTAGRVHASTHSSVKTCALSHCYRKFGKLPHQKPICLANQFIDFEEHQAA